MNDEPKCLVVVGRDAGGSYIVQLVDADGFVRVEGNCDARAWEFETCLERAPAFDAPRVDEPDTVLGVLRLLVAVLLRRFT